MEKCPASTTTSHYPSPPPTPVTISDPSNPYPTTFVQADTTSFKKVVQMLTGSSERVKAAGRPDGPARNPIPPMKTGPTKKPSKLYERRSSMKNFKISPLAPGIFTNDGGIFSGSPRNSEILSPSLLDFPSLVLSPVTPLISDPFNRSPVTDGNPNLHPSPVTTPRREAEPQLLPLFPLTSPKLE